MIYLTLSLKREKQASKQHLKPKTFSFFMHIAPQIPLKLDISVPIIYHSFTCHTPIFLMLSKVYNWTLLNNITNSKTTPYMVIKKLAIKMQFQTNAPWDKGLSEFKEGRKTDSLSLFSLHVTQQTPILTALAFCCSALLHRWMLPSLTLLDMSQCHQ